MKSETPFENLSDDKQSILYEAAFDILGRDNLKFPIDESIARRFARESYDPKNPKRALKRLFRQKRKERAEELGISEQTMTGWIRRHGLALIWKDADCDQRLFERIGMHERREAGPKRWMQEYRERICY